LVSRWLKRSPCPVHEMKSCAGRAPQRNVREAIVGRHVVVKPSLHVPARGGTSIDYAGHLAGITRFRDRRFLEPKATNDVSKAPPGESGAWREPPCHLNGKLSPAGRRGSFSMAWLSRPA
jgi:hypothetical protein